MEGGGGGRRGRSTEKQGKAGKERSQAHCRYRSPREARTLSPPPSQHPSGHPPCHHYPQKMQETWTKCFLGLHCREQQREALSLWNRHTCTAYRHAANVRGTHTPWVPGWEVVLQDVLRDVVSLLPPGSLWQPGLLFWAPRPNKWFFFLYFLLDK